jgi:CO/xanthine dehydrogenase Mo-binding subunit
MVLDDPRARPGETPGGKNDAPWQHDVSRSELKVIGKPIRKVDARGKVSGLTRFADDLSLPRMLHMKLLRSTQAHARIARIDVSKAKTVAGVKGILTGADLPIPFGILPVSQDEHALCPDKVRFVGDPVVAIAALTEDAAWDACRLVEVDYEPLRTIGSVHEAAATDEPRIHDYGVRGNIHRLENLEFGDLAAGFAASDHVREDKFFFEGNTHLPMEQHATLAFFDVDGKLTVWSSTQTPHYLHKALARVLAPLPAHRIRVIACPNGGGFGGKSDPFNHEICAAKMSMLTGRPVKIALTREEVFFCHRGRHPVLMHARIGVSKTGRIKALDFRSFLDGGAYAATAPRARSTPVPCRR